MPPIRTFDVLMGIIDPPFPWVQGRRVIDDEKGGSSDRSDAVVEFAVDGVVGGVGSAAADRIGNRGRTGQSTGS
jgi:hypothetical protein